MAQEKGVVTVAVPETPVQPIAPVVVQEDKRGFFDKVGDTLGEYVDQGKEFVTDIYDNFSKLDSTDSYKLEGTDLYSQEINKEANKTALERGLDATGDFFKSVGNNFIKPMYESEDSFIKKFTGTDLYRNKNSADTASEIIKNFYARNDVQTEKDPNKQAELQRELYDSLKPLIKPEKAESDEQIQKAIDELSISKQQERYQKEIAEDKLRGIIDAEVQEVVNQRFVGGNAFYNQGLIESFKRGATEELTTVLEMKKDLQISALELGIDKDEVDQRIARLDKIIDIKKRQITKGLEAAFKDNTAFEEDINGNLKIYNKAMEGLSNDEVKTLLDYERNNTKDLNTLLNVNRLNQLKKGGVLDRLGAGLSGIQGAVGLTFDTLDSALGIKTLLGGAVGRSYSVDDRESMLNALQSDENYLSMANRVGGAYVLRSALSNFDDIGQVILGGGVANKVTGVNKVVKFLDGVTGKARSAIATGAKGIIEGYAYNNQLSMASNELNTDDYQAMNAIIDPFAENFIAFASYMTRVGGNKVGLNFFDLGAAKRFKQFMIDNGDESYKTKDIELIRDQLKATSSLIKLNENSEVRKAALSTPETIAEYGKNAVKEIQETGSYTYKGDGLIVTEYSDAIRKASNPGYIFQNAGTIANKDGSYLKDTLNYFIENPDKVIKGLSKEDGNEVKGMIGTVRESLAKLGNDIPLEEKNKYINDISLTGYKIFDKVKGVQGGEGNRIFIYDLKDNKEYLVELDKYGKANLALAKQQGYSNMGFRYQESKLGADSYKRLNGLIEGTYQNANMTVTGVAEKLALDLGLKTSDIGAYTKEYNGEKKSLRVETLPDNRFKLVSDGQLDVKKLRLVQKGMERSEVLGLLATTTSYNRNIKTAQDAQELLFSLVPLLKDNVFDGNIIHLKDFISAAKLFLSSNKILGVLQGVKDDEAAKVLQQLIITAAVKMDGKEKLIGDILRMGDSNEGIVTKAKLISTIFTGVNPFKDTEIVNYADALKNIGVDNLSILINPSKKSSKKLTKVFDSIEKLYKNESIGKTFRNQYINLNNELIYRLYKESLTDDIISIIDPTYINIPKTISEHSKRYKEFINGIKDTYGLNNKTLGGLLESLKSKKLELEKEGKDIKNINEAINKIEVNYASNTRIENQLNELVAYIKSIVPDDSSGRATKELISAKATLMDIMKSIENLNNFDKSLSDKLEQVGNALISKQLSIGSDKGDLEKYIRELNETIVGMEHGLGDYNRYIDDEGELIDYGYTPQVTSFKSILSFKPEDRLIRYRGIENKLYEDLKEGYEIDGIEYKIDIEEIRGKSLNEGQFLFNIMNNKIGQSLLNSFAPATMDVDPISVNTMLDRLDGIDGLLNKIESIDNYIYNVQKYLISRGIYTDVNGKELSDRLELIRSYYIYVATSKEIDLFPNKEKKTFKEILIEAKEDPSKLGELITEYFGLDISSRDAGIELAKFIFNGKNKELDFYKAQSDINKQLLNGTPLDYILKEIGFTGPHNIVSEIVTYGDKLTNIKGNTILNTLDTKVQNNIFNTATNILNKFKKEGESDINISDKANEIKGDIKSFIDGFIATGVDKIDNYVLDKIISILPKQFSQRNIVDFDIEGTKNLLKSIYKTEIGKGYIDGLAGLGDLLGKKSDKNGLEIIYDVLDKIKRKVNKLQNEEYKVESKDKITNIVINNINKTVLNNVSGDVNGKQVKDILIENNDEIMKNLNNSLRSLSEKVGREVITLDGMKQKKNPALVEHSDGINKIFSLKHLYSINLDFVGKKYDDVVQYEFTERFYSSLNNKTKNLDNSEIKTLYTVINNIKYIVNKTGIPDIKFRDIDLNELGLGGVKEYITEDLFNNIYKYSGRNYLAMPTGGEEANKGFAINPTKEYLNNIGTIFIEKPFKDKSGNKTSRLINGKTILEFNNLVDDLIFNDVTSILELPKISKGDLAKRFKGLIAGGTGILRDAKPIVSIMLEDSSLVGMYGLNETAGEMNGGSYNEKRVLEILKGEEEIKLTDKEIKTIKDLLESKEELYKTDGTIPEKKISYSELVKDGISEFETNFSKIGDKTITVFGSKVKVNDEIKKSINEIKNIKNISKQELISNITEGISKINKYNEGGNLDEFKNLFEKAKKDAESFDKDGITIPAQQGKSLDEMLNEDFKFARDAYIYTLSKKNKKVGELLQIGLKDFKLNTFSGIKNDEYGKDTLSVVGKFLVKEPTDGMGYMSRNLAIDIYEDRTFNKFNDDGKHDDKLPDLKSHMLGDGVFEKSRQVTLTKEFDKHIRNKLGLNEDDRFVISFKSAVKTGKKVEDFKYDFKLKGTEVELYGTKLKVLGTRNINSNHLKLASSDAIEDKDDVTISMQLLASADAVMYHAIQNMAISNKLNNILREGYRLDTGRVMTDGSRGVHNSVTLSESIKNMETELFNTLKGMSASGSMLKIVGEEKYLNKVVKKLPNGKKETVYKYEYTERNTGYVSEYKFKKLLDAGQLKEHPTLKGQYYALGFRNPVPSPYNMSVLNIKIDYSMRGKNLKIHPEDTFLKKEGDFDADTVNLITFGKDDYTFKALFLSGLNQTTLDFKHGITFNEAKGDINELEKKIDKAFEDAMVQLGKQVNEGTFFNKYVPTEQVGEGVDDKPKSSFATNTMQGAFIEASVAKEKVGVVSVSQEWLYYVLNAITEHSQNPEGNLGGTMIGNITIDNISEILDVNANGFYAKFASILQTTLDFAKSTSEFPKDWLDKEIKSLMKDQGDNVGLETIKETIQVFAKNIKRYKNIDIREFKAEEIPDLPPALKDRYTMIRRGLDRIADLKLLEGEYDASYKEFYLRHLKGISGTRIKYGEINEAGKQDDKTLEIMVNEYFSMKRNMPRDERDALVETLLGKDNPAYILYRDFQLTDITKYDDVELRYDKGTPQYNALYSLVDNKKIADSIQSEDFSILHSGDKIIFKYTPNLFNYMDLIRLYGDKMIGKDISVREILGLDILGYNNVLALSDELKRTDEVITNMNLMTTISSKNRKKILESKLGDKLTESKLNELESIIGSKFNDSKDYEFIKDITGITTFDEFKDFNSKYQLDFKEKGENYDVVINKIQRGFIDEVINEIEFKGNLNYSLRGIYNNIETSYNRGELVTQFVVNSNGEIVNTKSIDINGDSFIPNTININKGLIEKINGNDGNVSDEVKQYAEDIVKYTYRLNPANAVSTMKEFDNILKILANKNSWGIFDRLMRYAPDIATRLTQRDVLDGNGLQEYLDKINNLRKNLLKTNTKGWVNKIDNTVFRQGSRGQKYIELDILDDALSDIEIMDLKNYKDEVVKLFLSDNQLQGLINKIKFNTNNIGVEGYNSSYLMDFLEIGNGQHQWVLNEFGLQNKKDFIKYIKNKNPDINEAELNSLADEVYLDTNKNPFWKFIRFIKSNMYTLAFSPVLVPAALVVTLLQMVPDFFINISKKSKSFGDPLVDSLIREWKLLDSETIKHSKNLHDTMDVSVLQTPARWLGNIVRMASSNPAYKEFVSNLELIASNGFAANDVILGPLRRKVAATRAFDTVIDLYGGMDKFKSQVMGDTEKLDKFMNIVRLQSHSNFLDLSGGSSTSRLSQTTIFSSGMHNLWNFMQTWSTSMVNQHIKAASNLHQSVSKLIQGDRTAALGHFKQFSEYLGGQLRMNIAIAAALAKYQIVFNENRNEDGEYDVMSYIKVLNNTYAGLSSFSPLGMATGSWDRLDSNNGMMYNLAAISEEVTGRFGREFNLPKNLVQYVSHAIKNGVAPEAIIDGAYDILTDRTNGFMKYNKFELQDGNFQDTYVTNLFGTAMGVNDFTSYQEFKDNIRKYGTQRAFEELSTQGQLGVILGSSNYIKMIMGTYSDDGSFKVYNQLIDQLYDIRNKDDVYKGLIANGITKEALNKIMLTNNKLDEKNIEDIFYDLVNYSARGLGDSIKDETGLTAFQWAKNPKGANIIDNLVVSQLNEKYGKEIVDAIARNDYATISGYVKAKLGPDMLKSLVPTGNQSVDEAALRKMLLIAGEKSELTIPTIVSTLIWDKAYDLQQNYGLNKEQARYEAIQMYGPLASGNLGMINDVANVYTLKKYGEQLKQLSNKAFKDQFSKSLENKLLIDMAVGRAMYEEGDVESAELRGDMTAVFNKTYFNMKEKNGGVLSKDDAMKLMIDYDYIDTQLNKLNGKADPLKLFSYREGVFLSMLNKPDMLAEIENNDSFNKKWSDVKDNLTHRFLKFAGERKNYELDSFEEMVRDKYHKEIGLKTNSYGGKGSYGGFAKSNYKPKTSGGFGGGGFGGGGQPLVQRAMDRGIDHTSSPKDLFRNNPYSYVPSMGGPKAYYDETKIGFEQMYKQMYEQFSKDLVKSNPEYINKIYTIKKMGAERVGLKSNLIRKDYAQIPRIRYSQLSKGLIPGWAYKREM